MAPVAPVGPDGHIVPVAPVAPCGPGGPGLPALMFITIGCAASVYGIIFTPISSTATPIAANTTTVALVMEKVEKINYICNPSEESLKGVSKKQEDY